MERLLLKIHLVPRISRTAALIFPAEMKNFENLLNPLLPFGNMETIAKVNVRKHSSFALEPILPGLAAARVIPAGRENYALIASRKAASSEEANSCFRGGVLGIG
jgi:hypothetical protein